MFSKLWFSGFKKFVTKSVLRSSYWRRHYWILKLLSATMHANCVWLFCYLNFQRSYDVLKWKSPCILLNNKINFNKNETESKMKNPTRRNFCFSLYKNNKLKVKLWWVGVRERKKRAFFAPFISSEKNFLIIFPLSHCIVF